MERRVRSALRTQLLPLAGIFAVLVAVVGGRSVLVERQAALSEAVVDAFGRQRDISAVLSLVQDAETSKRGYLLTGAEPYLEPYRAAVAAIPDALETLKKDFAGDPAVAGKVATLEGTVAERLAEMAEVIDRYRSGGDAGDLIRGEEGKKLTDEIRALLADMQRTESAALAMRLGEAQQVAEWQRYASVVGGAAIVALGLFGFVDLRRRMRAIADAYAEIDAANAALRAEMATRQEAEAQVRQMQKMEAVGQLSGGIAHDFNNMLAVIMSALNLIQRKLVRGETDIGKFVDSATDAVNRAAALTQRLLAFSRQQPLSPRSVDANRLVSGMSELLRRALGAGVSVETVLAGGLWRTYADVSQLENAILNLAVNARDAMAEDGRLTIETANAHLDDAYARAHAEVQPGQYVMIAVTDTGSGMTPDVLARAFEPFFTTKPVGKGTGLGLSQVFGFVKQSGGHLKIYTEPGQGTTIKIYLPRYSGEKEETMPDRPAAPGAAASETILVVEDDESVRAGTVATLGELGYRVVQAADATEALHRLEANADIALVFTDIVMPGMNGRKLADEIAARFPTVKVLFTTGFTRNAVVHNGVLDHGVNFIAKPFTIEQLAHKLRDVLDG
ncbi:two-component system, cell cycle sensor histidine kinase and response regulator CckA [Rhizobiaceae bacterium]|nr:two-component system, cell cycle sensor histidine kinase and response regulator CckA [Rhizobiaceae bacterium]